MVGIALGSRADPLNFSLPKSNFKMDFFQFYQLQFLKCLPKNIKIQLICLLTITGNKDAKPITQSDNLEAFVNFQTSKIYTYIQLLSTDQKIRVGFEFEVNQTF